MPSETDPHDDDADDALHWDGDDETRAVLPRGWHAKGRGADRVVTEPDAAAAGASESAAGEADAGHEGHGAAVHAAATDAPADASSDGVAHAQPGNAALIGLGVLGGVYLLFTIGWIVGGLRLQSVATYLVSPVASVPAVWLAVLAPAIWFASALWLTRRARPWLRFTWLIVGAVLLVPWPFALLGGVGQ